MTAVGAGVIFLARSHDAANDRPPRGISTILALVQAARHRVVRMLVVAPTSGGLFALACGLRGRALLWQPVAAGIGGGAALPTVLPLSVAPMLYLACKRRRTRGRRSRH
jgi:multidrug efflux pump subunit AcrB